MDSKKLFDQAAEHMRLAAKIESAVSLLEWDNHTYAPSGSGEYRADQVSYLSGLVHERRTDQEFGKWITELERSELAQDHTSPVGSTIALWMRDYKRQIKLPQKLVEAIAKATSLGQMAWVGARSANKWSDFQPHLTEIIRLRREEAQLLADGGNAYDALLDQYEPGARSEEVTKIFAELRDELVKLLGDLKAKGQKPSGTSWQCPIDLPNQRKASQWIAEKIGYSFERGRLDETAHPFCTTLGPNDCRILTRYHEDNFLSGFYSTLHEAATVCTNKACRLTGMDCHLARRRALVCMNRNRGCGRTLLVGARHSGNGVFRNCKACSDPPGETQTPCSSFAMSISRNLR